MIQHGYINQWMINHDGSLLLATFIWVNYNIIIYYILYIIYYILYIDYILYVICYILYYNIIYNIYIYIPKFCTIATKWSLQHKVHAKK